MDSTIRFSHSRVAPKTGNVSKVAPKVDARIIEKAFSARAVAKTEGLDVFSLRTVITEMLASNGGRPSITGASAQVKIPRIESDWRKLDRITKAAENLPHKPSVTQAAALVLHVALSKMSEDELEAELMRAFS